VGQGRISTRNRAWNRNHGDRQKDVSELTKARNQKCVISEQRNRDWPFCPTSPRYSTSASDGGTMRRLSPRAPAINELGKQPEELESCLSLNRSERKPAGA